MKMSKVSILVKFVKLVENFFCVINLRYMKYKGRLKRNCIQRLFIDYPI